VLDGPTCPSDGVLTGLQLLRGRCSRLARQGPGRFDVRPKQAPRATTLPGIDFVRWPILSWAAVRWPRQEFGSVLSERFFGLMGDVGCMGTGRVTAIEREALDLAVDRV
jgi:hypothetical protein